MSNQAAPAAPDRSKLLFIGCWIALVTTSFGFVLRAMLINTWGEQFGLTEVQKGEIFGVGLWPFSISIVLFSLVIDRIGYGKAMLFAFLCHVGSAVLTILAKDYWSLYVAMFIVALGNGAVEAVINPVIATVYRREKTKWLNILHAGWPAGMVLGGMLALTLGSAPWQYKIALLLVPAAIYGVILARCTFPVQERVAAGVSHRDMLREAGGLGAFIVVFLITAELGRVASARGIVEWGWMHTFAVAVVLAGIFGAWVRSAGRCLFVILLLLMIPLATTELGTDSWITPLMEGEMAKLGLSPVWVLIYTSTIMMVLRLFAGPLVHRLSPLGLLAAGSLLAAVGLVLLSNASGAAIFLAATVYGLGKTFFWPTMLGIVSERFPKGGALTLNAAGGVGMLSVGVVGTVFLGYWQDTRTSELLHERNPVVYEQVVREKDSVLGRYEAVAPELAAAIVDPAQKQELAQTTAEAQKRALYNTALFPVIMLVSYLLLLAYFRMRGGYGAEVLHIEGEGRKPAT